MTKIYRGEPDGNVFVDEDGIVESRLLMVGAQWGVKTSKASRLSLAILADMIGGPRAETLYTRFNYRTVVTWPAGVAWSKSEEQLMAVVDDIKKTAAESLALARAPPERPMAILAVAGAPPAEWTKNPELNPNIAKKEG